MLWADEIYIIRSMEQNYRAANCNNQSGNGLLPHDPKSFKLFKLYSASFTEVLYEISDNIIFETGKQYNVYGTISFPSLIYIMNFSYLVEAII